MTASSSSPASTAKVTVSPEEFTFVKYDAAEIAGIVADLAERLGVAYRRIRIGGQRTLWGSCSPGGTLSFNWRLVLAPFAVLARSQRAGRGRLGRKWHSAQSGNLYLSLAFRPFIPPERLKPFTLWMGLALCSHVEKSLGLKLGLKWPNDLQTPDGRKVAGMLTEARLDSDSVRELVFGLGLNLTGQPKDFPAEIRATAGSLEAALGAPIDVNREAAAVIAALFHAWEQFEEGTWSRSFRKLWQSHDVLAGKSVRVGLRGDPVAGIVDGIDEEGSLILRTGGGRKTIVSSGEVTLRKP